MLKKFIGFIIGTPQQQVAPHQLSAYKRAVKEHELIKKESKIGGTLFGSVPKGHEREFFCLNQHVWIWDEQWYDETEKVMKQMHIRYEFQQMGVLKTVDGVARGYVEAKELKNLMQAIRTYYERVAVEVYGKTVAHA